MSLDIESDSLLIETVTTLKAGLDILDRLPDNLGEDLTIRKGITADAIKKLLDKWVVVKSIVPEFITDDVPKEKPKLKTKLRSGSVGDLLDVSLSTENNYANIISGFHSSAGTTKTRKKSIQNMFKFTPSPTNLYSSLKGTSDKTGATIVRKFSGPFKLDEKNFTMTSDGRFSLLASQVRLQIGTDKPDKNLYCGLQENFLLFGPLLTNTPPIKVINVETCQLGYTNKREIQLIDGDTKYLIKFSPDANTDLWIDKIRDVHTYTYIRHSILVDQIKPEYQSAYSSVDDPGYSYVRQERYLGQNRGEYSYTRSVDCHDCYDSIGRKTSTAEAIIDKSYVNTSSMHSVRSLVSHFQRREKL